jgi:hypothetical protein
MKRLIGGGGTSSARRGSALMLVLIVLVLIVVIEGVLVQGGVVRRRQLREQERTCQASWLVEAGIGRGTAAALQDSTYNGETWEVPADELDGRAGGIVWITVKAVDGQPARRRIRADAEFPRDEPRRARQGRAITINVRRESSGERDDDCP